MKTMGQKKGKQYYDKLRAKSLSKKELLDEIDDKELKDIERKLEDIKNKKQKDKDGDKD